MSFFSMAVERALAVTGKSGKVIIITGKSHIPLVVKEAAKLKAGEKKRLLVIGEPAAKSTAPAIACAAIYSLHNSLYSSLKSGKDRNMLVLTSDHIIKPIETFKDDSSKAAASAKEGKLVVFGIPPTSPETGYGYIEAGKGEDVLNVAAFHEKPDLKTAKKYTANRRFFWNSGMFAFSAGFIKEQFRLLAPDVIQPFEKLKAPTPQSYNTIQGVQVLDAWPGLENAYRKTASVSFDYAIAEKCQNTVMVRANFDWVDIGNWEEYVNICGSKSLVFSVSGENCRVDSDIPVALAGVEDLIVVIRSGKNGGPAAALVTKKGQTQKVREVVEQIKKAGKTELL